MINAVPHQLRKRETKFGLCHIPEIEQIDVTITPDPIVSEKPTTYTISGTLKVNNIIAKETYLEIIYSDMDNNLIGSPYIHSFTESYKAGEPFTITVKDFPTPKLPKTYIIIVAINDYIGNPKAPYYACEFATVGGTLGEEAYPIAGFPIASYPIAERSYPIAERS